MTDTYTLIIKLSHELILSLSPYFLSLSLSLSQTNEWTRNVMKVFFFLHRTYFLALVRHPPAHINAPTYLVEWQLVCRSSEVGIVTVKLYIYIYTFLCLYSNQAHSIVHAKRRLRLKGNQQLQEEQEKKNNEKIILYKKLWGSKSWSKGFV